MSSNAWRWRLIGRPGGDLAKTLEWATRLPKLTTAGKYSWQSDIFVSNVGSCYLSCLRPRSKQCSQQQDEASLWGSVFVVAPPGSVLVVAPPCKTVQSEVVRRFTAHHWPVRRRLVPVCEKRPADKWQLETDLFINWTLPLICMQSVHVWVVAGSWKLRSVEPGSRTHSASYPANTGCNFSRRSTSRNMPTIEKHKLAPSRWTAQRCIRYVYEGGRLFLAGGGVGDGGAVTFSVRTCRKEVELVRRCPGMYGHQVRPN